MGNSESAPDQGRPKLVKKKIQYPKNIQPVQYKSQEDIRREEEERVREQQRQYLRKREEQRIRQEELRIEQENQMRQQLRGGGGYQQQQPQLQQNYYSQQQTPRYPELNSRRPEGGNRRMEDMLMERGQMMVENQQRQYQQNVMNGGYQPYPESSRRSDSSQQQTQIMRRDMETLNLTPYHFQDEIETYTKNMEDERIQYEDEERKRRQEFKEYQRKKEEYMKREIEKFEENYNPFEILGLPKNHFVLSDIKKAYKKMALKYHPDKVGDQYKDKFQLITQAYIYLLNKAEEVKEVEVKMSKKVTKMEYRDDINEDGVQNIYVNKDKFNLKQFNEIFEKYYEPDEEIEVGYGEMYKQRDDEIEDESKVFGKNFNKDVFNAHFDDIKKKKRPEDLQVSRYQEPEAYGVATTAGFRELGSGRLNDYSGNSSLNYTDYRKAHVQESVLIDPKSVKLKEYRNVDQLKNEREQLSYQATHEDSLRYQTMERLRREREEEQQNRLRDQDRRYEQQYRKINQKLIVHK